MNNIRTEAIELNDMDYVNKFSDYKLYLDECMCVYNTSNKCDENCIKRHYTLKDLDGKKKLLFVCHSYIKYKIQEEMLNNHKWNGYNYYEDVISKIIVEALNLDEYGYSTLDRTCFYYNTTSAKYRDLLGRQFTIQICSKPTVYIYLDINEYIEYAHKYKDIASSLATELRCYFDKNIYKKYKTKYKKVITILNRLHRLDEYRYSWNKNHHIESDMLEIFEILYTMKISEKSKK
jgi:hypothetical protein